MRYLLPLIFTLGTLAQGPDPTALGPLTVATADFKFGAVTLPTVSYPVDVWGAAWYPEDLSKGPFPLVVLLHGNHGICRRLPDGGFFCAQRLEFGPLPHR